MQTLYLLLALTLVSYWVESSPANIGILEFDSLDADLDSLSYEVEEEDLEDYAKQSEEDAENNYSKKKSNKINGYNKNNSINKGSSGKHNTKDLKKFFKGSRVHDQATYDDDDVYGNVQAVAAQATGITGNEDRKYKKGTKTRGFHRVHHKDEYKKDKTFYEDNEVKGRVNKVGAKGLGYKFDAGTGFHKGHFHHDRDKGIHGRQEYLDKGLSDKKFTSYTNAQFSS